MSSKIVIVGNSGVGKTAFVRHLMGARPESEYRSTQNFAVWHLNSEVMLWDVSNAITEGCFMDTTRAVIIVNSMKDVDSIAEYEDKIKKTCCNVPFNVLINTYSASDNVESIYTEIRRKGYQVNYW